MAEGIIYILVMAVVVGVVGVFVLLPVRRRRRLMEAPLPDGYPAIIEKNLEIWQYLPEKMRRQLAGRVNVFLAEKAFEGCGGATADEEIKVTVAAAACVMLLGQRNTWCYPSLRSVLIYPDAYVVPEPQMVGENLVVEEDDVLDGTCFESGTIILGRKQVLEECRDYGGGCNVVFHEFAHQIDEDRALGAYGYTALTPDFMRCFQRFEKAVKGGEPDILDEYGAEDPAEFFAVAVEAFFDTPRELRHWHPDLYQILKQFFRLDPALWI